MADTYDDDLGGVEGVPTPPRHPEDIKKQVNGLRDMLMDFMMENMSDYAELDPKSFAQHTAHNIGFLLGIADMANIRTHLRTFTQSFEDGVADAQEVLDEREENNG